MGGIETLRHKTTITNIYTEATWLTGTKDIQQRPERKKRNRKRNSTLKGQEDDLRYHWKRKSFRRTRPKAKTKIQTTNEGLPLKLKEQKQLNSNQPKGTRMSLEWRDGKAIQKERRRMEKRRRKTNKTTLRCLWW